MYQTSRSHRFGAILGLCGAILLLTALALPTTIDVLAWWQRSRGIETGLDPEIAPLERPRFGVNVSLELYESPNELHANLARIREAGLGTIRQRFAWADLQPAPDEYRWERWDDTLAAVHDAGLRVIAVLDTSPAWARPEWEQDNHWAPPAAAADYARFCAAFAERYGQYIQAYQIWDQPNISPHWGQGEIDPAAYLTFLQQAGRSIKEQDGDALIIAGALAPNLEMGGRNMSDVLFLQEIYRLGAADSFDVLGVKAYGFWSGAEDRRASPDTLNFSRNVLLRREMTRHGDAAKPVWAVEAGWCGLPEDWPGAPAPQGSDRPFIQAERLAQAIQRVRREWPWMDLMCIGQWQPAAAPEDPAWGYALLSQEGNPSPLLERVSLALSDDDLLYPGFHDEPAKALRPLPDSGRADFCFWGTHLVLWVEKGTSSGTLTVQVEDQISDVTIELDGKTRSLERVRVGSHLPPGKHKVRLYGAPEQLACVRAIQVGHRRQVTYLVLEIATMLVLGTYLVIAAWRALGKIAWRQTWHRLQSSWGRLPHWLQALAVTGSCAVMMLAPWSIARLAGLAAYGMTALLRPDLALLVAIASIPFAPIRIRLGPGSFGPPEIAVLIAAGAHFWSRLASIAARRTSRPRRSILLDWAILLLAALATVSCLWAEYQRVAFRELRVVVLEPALLYLLLRTQPGDRHKPLRWVDTLWLSGLCVAFYALAMYPLPQGVIEAEGVRRARAFYGSPNNLALYIERLLPLGLAMALWGRTRCRRWLYGLGSLAVVLALVLTYSRGTLLIGLPIIVGTLLFLHSRKTRWLLLFLTLVGLALLLPLMRTERFASLLDTSQGTTFLRLSLWQSSLEMVRDHPLLGLGLDNFLYYYGDYIKPGARVDRWLSHPHNTVLDFWLRLGLGGLVTLAALLTGCVLAARRALQTQGGGDSKAALIGLLVGLVACLAHGMVDTAFFVTELAYWLIFALAAVANAATCQAAYEHAETRLDSV